MEKHHLEDVFEREFKDAKDNFKAQCPFHDERTPSFYVHKYDLIAHCFGCGVSGFIDTLAARYLGVPEKEVRERLDVDIVKAKLDSKKRERRAPQTFPESWLAPFERKVHKYVIDRGFTIDTIKFAKALYDPAQKRQVFPHYRRDGRLLGVAGRACTGREPKWLFYWSYDKGQALYKVPLLRSKSDEKGLHDSTTQTDLGSSNREHRLIVVEGIFDLLWLKQHGYDNVVATLGTQVTERQINELKEISSSITLCFDNDDSGKEASNKVYKALKGVETSFIKWPDHAKDMMDLSKEQLDTTLANPQTYLQRRLSNGLS